MARKNPEADLRLVYKKVIEIGLIIALGFCILLFQAFKKFEAKEVTVEKVDIEIEVTEVEKTIQEKLPPPPARPAVPIESEDDDIPEDERKQLAQQVADKVLKDLYQYRFASRN